MILCEIAWIKESLALKSNYRCFRRRKQERASNWGLTSPPSHYFCCSCVCVAGIWIGYCLMTTKRAGFQICELEALNCVPERNKRAKQSRWVEKGVLFDNKILLTYRSGGSAVLPPLPNRGTRLSFQKKADHIQQYKNLQWFPVDGYNRNPQHLSTTFQPQRSRFIFYFACWLLPVPPKCQALIRPLSFLVECMLQ